MTAPEYLGPVRAELDRLRTENERLRGSLEVARRHLTSDGHPEDLIRFATLHIDSALEGKSRPFALITARADKAEARVEALTQELATVRDTLRHRSNALNATGTHNDQLRAQLERIRALPNHWRALLDRGMEFGIEACIDDMHAILADKEPTP